MSQTTFLSSDVPVSNDHDSDQSEYTQALECNTLHHESPRDQHNCCIEQMEPIDNQEGSGGCKSLQKDFNGKDCQKNEVDCIQ